MGLIDRARDIYFDRARERWKQEGFDADITDILDDYREETNKKIARDRENVLITFLISLYDYDHASCDRAGGGGGKCGGGWRHRIRHASGGH